MNWDDITRGGDLAPAPAGVTKQKVRFRLVITIPMLTTLLVLGLGFVLIDVQQRTLVATQPTRMNSMELYARISQTMDLLTVIIIIAAVIAFISGVVLAITVTSPIKKLAEDTAGIARGDLTRSIRLNADGELAQLGTALNEMVASINRYMLQSMTGGLITINQDEQIIAMSGDAEFILGVNADRMVGSHITAVFPDIPENRPFLEELHNTLKLRRTFPTQKFVLSTEERSNIPVSVATSLLRDQEDTLVALSISFEDVKQLRRIEEQMRRVDRLTTLGGLAASVAHQIRNPLCSIRGLAQLMREGRGGDATLAGYTDVILSDVDRIDQVVGRLLSMLQPSDTNWTVEDINNILADTMALARHETRGKDIELIEDYGGSLPQTSTQRENLMHALLNLVINAIQAVGDSGRVSVSSRAMISWDRPVTGPGQTPAGILVEIADSGPGMTPDVLERIFNPNFTTKESGSGFGLTIASQTIEAHGGEIVARSAPGEGAVFRVWLPIRDPAAQREKGETLESAAAE